LFDLAARRWEHFVVPDHTPRAFAIRSRMAMLARDPTASASAPRSPAHNGRRRRGRRVPACRPCPLPSRSLDPLRQTE